VLGAVFALFLSAASAAEDPAVILVEDGTPRASIYVEGPLASEAEIEAFMAGGARGSYSQADIFRSAAVLDLNRYLARITGTTLPVVETTETGSIASPAIVLGALANELGGGPDRSSPTREGFRISTADGAVRIGAESDLGLRHGVYTFLRTLGVEWVMPGEIGEVVPQAPDLVIPSVDVSQAPDFTFRNPWYRGYPGRNDEDIARFTWWTWRHLAGAVPDPAENTQGHVWQRLVQDYAAEFARDPTMLALVQDVDGSLVRRGPQLETTNPKVAEIFVREIRATYARNIAAGVWTAETPAGFAIGPADGLGYSLSPESIAAGSRRMDPIVGAPDQTDLVILLANDILDAVRDEYPNALVGYYSYATHADYPVRHVPDPNVVQVFAPINFSRFHGVTDPVSKTQTFFRGVVEKWAALASGQGNRLSFYGYNWNLAESMMPYTKVRIWGEDLPFYHAHGIRGLTLESTKQWSVLAPSDYVFMRMAWDVSQDWRDLLRTYCEKAYGAGSDRCCATGRALRRRSARPGWRPDPSTPSR
jgi:hypothetical protein